MSSDFPAMSLRPHSMLPQVRQLIGWEDAAVQLTLSKVNLLNQVHALQALPEAMDDEGIQAHIVRCCQQIGEMEREIEANAQACERLFRILGPDFQDELKTINAKDRLAALHVLEQRFTAYEEEYSRLNNKCRSPN